MIKFYDTCSLLNLQSRAFDSDFVISSITLSELENIKTSKTKDEKIKFASQQLLYLLNNNVDKYKTITYNTKWDKYIKKFGLILCSDSRIIVTAYVLQKKEKDNLLFITSDMSCRANANSIGLNTQYALMSKKDEYTGYKKVTMKEEELAQFYSELNNSYIPQNNKYNLLANQYLLIEYDNKIIGQYKWANDHYVEVKFNSIESKMFGKTTPYKGDAYQICALDSLSNNQITVIRGKAGSGKSYLAMAYLFNLLEHNKIDKIIIFANTVAVRGAAKLGFYPGSKNDKLLDSQIGNFLVSKLGNIVEIEKMIDEGTLLLLPTADLRGFDSTGMKAGIYITEAQNASIDMMKLMLQRIGEDCIAIIEGDDKAQVDMNEYSGDNNGLRRMSQVFKGQDFYGEIRLENIYRSKIAAIADNL